MANGTQHDPATLEREENFITVDTVGRADGESQSLSFSFGD